MIKEKQYGATIYSTSLIGIESVLVRVEASVVVSDVFKISIFGLSKGYNKTLVVKIISIINEIGINLKTAHYIINISNNRSNDNRYLDLPVFTALLIASGRINENTIKFLKDSIVMGELTLHGEIKGISGCLSVALSLDILKKDHLIIPYENKNECSMASSSSIIALKRVNDIFNILTIPPLENDLIEYTTDIFDLDFDQVHGQYNAKRALEIAAAGRHHILFYGPPGSGKTMMSQRIPTILPPMELQEKIESTRIYSSAGLLHNNIISRRPFRNPHYTISSAGLIGGGRYAHPGEVSLAHNGVLFLDELLEFRGNVLETLRQVLEDGKVSIKRAEYSVTYPSEFLLIASLNPCPCGYYGDGSSRCNCSFIKIKDYLSKLSGPILDRIDMQIGLQPSSYEDISHSGKSGDSSAIIRERVMRAVDIQIKRNPSGTLNGMVPGHLVDKISLLSPVAKEYLKKVFSKLKLTMRSYFKIIKISRTIADLELSKTVEVSHIKEALIHRSLDKVLSKFNG